MRRLLKEAGLTAPVFVSHVIANEFQATYLLHQLLGEEQLGWLKQYAHLGLSDDEARAMILAKETGAVDNAGLRAVTGLDTLSASQVLKRLHHQHQLLQKGGAGPSTYYRLSDVTSAAGELPLFSDNTANTGDLSANTGDLGVNTAEFPAELQKRIRQLGPKARKEKLWPVIVWLCALKSLKAEQLAQLLGRSQVSTLKTNHINRLRDLEEFITYTHQEVKNHPEQAYVTTLKGREWLASQGIAVEASPSPAEDRDD